MTQIPSATVKDLLSTGYFFEDLKKYSKSADIDLSSYSREYAVPFLAKVSEAYERSGHTNRSKILHFAVKHLSDVGPDGLAGSIFGLKKVAASEIAASVKALDRIDQFDKSEMLFLRQKSESAELLAKLLVSIIRMFKLADTSPKPGKSEEAPETVGDTVEADWLQISVPAV
jgi:hypothetical protein